MLQAARITYQYSKLPALRAGIPAAHGGNIEFEVYAFFEACFHLVDWLTNGPDGRRFADARDYLKATPALRVCADICNTAKHRVLTHKPYSTGLGLFKMHHVITIAMGTGNSSMKLPTMTVDCELGAEYCCYRLADECVAAWAAYLKDKGVETTLAQYAR